MGRILFCVNPTANLPINNIYCTHGDEYSLSWRPVVNYNTHDSVLILTVQFKTKNNWINIFNNNNKYVYWRFRLCQSVGVSDDD